MVTYEVVEVQWLSQRKWGVKKTVRGEPPHICKLCDTREEAERIAARFGARTDANLRRAS